MSPAATIAIVGAGPRGLSILERLVANCRFLGDVSGAALTVEVIDPHEAGAGRIWRASQSEVLLMNTVIGQITIFGPDPACAERQTGPSFLEWLRTRPRAGGAEWGPDDYAPRQLYGEYLAHAYRAVVEDRPDWMRIRTRRDEVVRLVEAESGYALHHRSGRRSVADCVVLATGHQRTVLAPHQQKLADFARDRPDLHYVPPGSPADMPVEQASRDDVVALRGLGLTFYDIVALLTEHRGGTFERDPANTLVYRPSGDEPRILASSRSGLPFPARGVNQKRIGDAYQPVHCTVTQIDALRERARRTRMDDRLDFQTEVLPLVMVEVHRTFLTNLVRQRSGQASAAAFRDAFDRTVESGGDLHALRQRFAPDVPLPDLGSLARPLEGLRFASPRHFADHLTRYLKEDLRHAAQGNLDGPLKAALDVLRDLRGVIRHAVDHNGLLPKSQRWFESWYVPRNAMLSAGPPVQRVEQLVALMRSGIVEVVGPAARFETDPATGRFCVTSPNVAGSAREATWLVEATTPDTQLRDNASPLYIQMLADGLVTEHVNPADGSTAPWPTGGVAVTPTSFNAIDAAGQVRANIFVLGLPTEHARWFTQVGSSKPGASTSFTRDAEAIARSSLTQLLGQTIPDTAAPAVHSAGD
jgi:hypothetical protein